MPAASFDIIYIDTLFFQLGTSFPGEERKVSEAEYRDDIGEMDAAHSWNKPLGCICQDTLQRRYYGAAQNHHDKEGRRLARIFSEAGNSQRKYRWPHNRAAKAPTKERQQAYIALCQ